MDDSEEFLMLGYEPNYTDILNNLNMTKIQVENLDQDSLVDEIAGIQYNLVGDEAQQIRRLIFKAHADATLTDEELIFLRNVYVIYYCQFVLVIDEKEDDEDV